MNERAQYRRALANSHRIRCRIVIYDRNEDFVASTSSSIISGQVDVDTTRDVERSLSVVLADLGHEIDFDNDGHRSKAMYADNFISAEYHVWVETLNKWVREPIFFGPITRYERNGFEVHIEAQDKSSLLFQPYVWGKWLRNNAVESGTGSQNAADLLRDILASVGEPTRKLDFDEFERARLPRNFGLPKMPEDVWPAMKRIVRAANNRDDDDRFEDYRLFYDGAGVLRVESMSNGFRFTDDPETGMVLTKPQLNYSLENFRNTVVCRVNRGQSGRPVKPVVATLPDQHPLSAVSLARNGKKRYVVEVLEAANVRSRVRAKRLAKSALRRLSTEHVEAAFDCLPVPHLIPGSECVLEVDGDRRSFKAKQYSLPLRAEDSMSMGYLRRVGTKRFKPHYLRGISKKRFK